MKECPADKESEEQVGVFTFSYDQIQKKCHHFLAAETDGEKLRQDILLKILKF